MALDIDQKLYFLLLMHSLVFFFFFALLIVDASFIANDFLVTKPFINWFGLDIKLLDDSSDVDHNSSII